MKSGGVGPGRVARGASVAAKAEASEAIDATTESGIEVGERRGIAAFSQSNEVDVAVALGQRHMSGRVVMVCVAGERGESWIFFSQVGKAARVMRRRGGQKAASKPESGSAGNDNELRLGSLKNQAEGAG